MSVWRAVLVCDPIGRAAPRLFPARTGLCVAVVPLALVWCASASAADANTTGNSSSAAGYATTGSQASANSGYYEDNRPVVIGNGDVSGDRTHPPGSPDTSTPFGFGGGFAPSGCAPPAGIGDVATSETASHLDRPAAPVRSAGRYVRASVSGSETYTDNVNLDTRDPESDFVTTVAPRLDACSSTGRIRGQASYQLSGVVYANHSHYNDVYNDLQGRTTIDLIQNRLYLDADTEYGQQVIDPAIGYSRSNIIRPDENKTTAWETNLSPYFIQSLGPLGRGTLRYRYSRAIYDDDSVPDTTVNGVSASLISPQAADPVSWQAQVVTQAVKSSGGNEQRFIDQFREIFGDDALPDNYRNPNETQHFDSATAQLGYRVSRTITLTALGGVEDKYQDNGDNDRWSAPRWQVGVRWASASDVNTLEVNYGHRFYGASYSLSAAHRGRLMDLTLSYDEDPSSPGLDALNNTGSGYTFGSVGSIGGQLGGYGGYGYNGTNSLLDRGVYVRKRWQARIGFDTALTRTEITGYSQREDYQSAAVPDSRRHGVELDTRYDIGPRTRLVPSANWEHYNGGFIRTASSDNYTVGASLVRAISPSAQAAIGYSRDWRDDDNGYDYHENRVTLQFRKAF